MTRPITTERGLASAVARALPEDDWGRAEPGEAGIKIEAGFRVRDDDPHVSAIVTWEPGKRDSYRRGQSYMRQVAGGLRFAGFPVEPHLEPRAAGWPKAMPWLLVTVPKGWTREA